MYLVFEQSKNKTYDFTYFKKLDQLESQLLVYLVVVLVPIITKFNIQIFLIIPNTQILLIR
jgi:hypothetical protein